MTARTRRVGDLAAELDVSAEWVRRQVRAGRFPHHRIAQQIRFTDDDVAAIIADLAVPAVAPAPAASAPARRRYAVYPAPTQ